ncbi:MAG: hypothetical protein KFF68_02240 [Desulfosarcina sp.]|nr:hypothetical protein [Desulfosarcina sp.]
MNKMLYFLAAVLLVFAIDLFHFEAPPGASQDTNGNTASQALAEFNGDAENSNLGFGFKLEFNSQTSDDTASVSPGKVFDPVTMLLLGSGLIGLAGLGRKKV